MAYSPVDQGRLLRHNGLNALAAGLDSTAAQVALAWLLAQDGVAAIPKATDPAHVREVRAAADLRLSPAVFRELDRMFPPLPNGPRWPCSSSRRPCRGAACGSGHILRNTLWCTSGGHCGKGHLRRQINDLVWAPP